MKKRIIQRIGDFQLEILKVLWDRGEATVLEALEALRRKRRSPVAYTTVATMLKKMESRRLVKHRVAGRRFIYCAALPPETVTRGVTLHVLDRLFEGSLADMVSHLLTQREISPQELQRLEHLIQERKDRHP